VELSITKLGVRTIRPIPKGMFICRYIGEVITEAEAESRGEEYDRKVFATQIYLHVTNMQLGDNVSF